MYFTSSYAVYAPISPIHDQSRIELYLRLASGKLRNMPAGFPFCYTSNGITGSICLSYDSYEFVEEITGHSAAVKLEYTKPSRSTGSQHFSWRIYPCNDKRVRSSLKPHRMRLLFSARASTNARALNPDKAAIAHVQVDPAVMDTSYGKAIRHDPSIILKALACSLNRGALVTICESNTVRKAERFPYLKEYSGKLHPKTILFVATGNDGWSEIIHTWSRS
ncbi:hypothetical protein VNI00_002937 [Paramarasmius palmivorus]|uniref:Uncharacterized protein n=1 Tax=Paramarasmius palmivorus TaxID=297713 RepID=A0AAW0DYV3_9AGAR